MGNVNMCKAIEDMIQDVVDEKKDDWLSEGRIQLLINAYPKWRY